MTHSLAELSESIFAALGLSKAVDHLELGESDGQRECLLLVDGLGRNSILEYASLIPTLAKMEYRQTLNATFPSTTATSLTSLGTGLRAGRHGMVGYTMRIPFSGPPERALNALKWDERVDPLIWQPNATLFERAIADQLKVSHVASRRYADTGFTRASLRGAEYLAANSINEIVESAKLALSRPRSFAYLYINDVDEASHGYGYGSDRFKAALRKVDELASSLLRELPKGTRLYLTSDHGMINRGAYEVIGKGNRLAEDVNLLAGEPRVRYLYVDEGREESVKLRWQEYFGDRAVILSRDEAIAKGFYGQVVEPKVLNRIGDLIAIAMGDLVLIELARESQQLAMVGHHGGLTPDEIEIPLLIATI